MTVTGCGGSGSGPSGGSRNSSDSGPSGGSRNSSDSGPSGGSRNSSDSGPSGGSRNSGGSGNSGDSRNAPASTPASHGPTPRAASPVRLCADLISYWAEQDLAGSQWAGLDWEQKGLSNEQYEIYDDIVRAARTERKRHGTPAAKALIKRLAERRCAAANGATHSSENWRPPA
ncbi:hypothetical protein [Streptomyces rapamycinicus]|uniref:hypothetical protein n=1 Tax=Streptomyces rapamycinicus TaxID=1226757 RepID=UPI000382F973|nr:hypothetical protein [Streptomyces rapamycinicus]AGP58683.1 hypothetical protein M271_36400 [Streptomyces rapamycinicus NRRL 5491]UTO66492.1 hypothetical protein LJB45_31925 [Streptomyces rapamycinicus]UTP34446.1 hypothetical protein LIV37_37055 [Streptomyces rapamycinicus NRRL 5491]